MTKQINNVLYPMGSILAIVGAVFQLFEFGFAPYLFSAGAAMIVFVQSRIALNAHDAGLRQQRLARTGLLSSLLLGLAAYYMFTHSNLWVIAVLMYSLTALFLSFRGNN